MVSFSSHVIKQQTLRLWLCERINYRCICRVFSICQFWQHEERKKTSLPLKNLQSSEEDRWVTIWQYGNSWCQSRTKDLMIYLIRLGLRNFTQEGGFPWEFEGWVGAHCGMRQGHLRQRKQLVQGLGVWQSRIWGNCSLPV